MLLFVRQVITSDNRVKAECVLQRVMTRGSRRQPDGCIHSRLIVGPPPVRYFDLGLRQAANALVQEMEEHEDVARASVEDPIVRSPGVGSKLAQLAGNLARPRIGERRAELDETEDMDADRDLVVLAQPEDRLHDRLSTVDVSVVHDWPHSCAE